jgi:heterodisulfide reductase subunit B
MKLGFYPGCSLKGGSPEYRISTFNVAKEFGVELVEIPDWNCCGATAAHNLNKELSLSLPARILALSEAAGLNEIVVPCAACYTRLSVTSHELAEDAHLRENISAIIDMKYSGTVKILNIIQFLEKYVMPTIEERVVKKFNHDVACYYGCLLVRPHNILKFDREEDPQTMDNVITKIGGNAIDWAFKTECCGAGLSVSRTDLVAKLSGKLMLDALDRGAQAIIVACPMCHSNLDMRRPAINKYMKRESDIPVIYITQAVGLAIGLSEKEVGLHHHMLKVNLRERPVTEPKAVKKALQTEPTEE